MNEVIATSPETLRQRMVERITFAGWARSDRVADAMRTVPRHRFVPDAPLEEAYADQAVITKRGADGAALSCASVPTIVAMMLDQLDVHPGHRILEIGAGTGYNAALLADLTGPSGEVTTVDIDEEVTGLARHALDVTGYGHVHVATQDGALGHAANAPYDRIIVTVGAWDLPPTWWRQLVPGGRLVVPLRWRGQSQALAFVNMGDHLRSDSVELCGFVPMVGQGGEQTGHIDLDGQVSLCWDSDQAVDVAALRGVLERPKAIAWSAVIVGREEPFDALWLRLAATDSRTCRIAADRTAVDSGLCTPAVPSRSPALVDAGSLAYFTLRRREEGGTALFELGAVGHGQAGPELAGRICEAIHSWSLDRRERPVVTAHAADTPDDQLLGAPPIDKHHARLVVAFAPPSLKPESTKPC